MNFDLPVEKSSTIKVLVLVEVGATR